MSIYGCHDEPRPIAGAPLLVQDGWFSSVLSSTRYPRMIEVPYVMTVPCQYTQQHPGDKECNGCPWKLRANSDENAPLTPHP